MTMNQIVESGMTFGPYPQGHCFFIEKSATYKKIQNNVKIAEFLLQQAALFLQSQSSFAQTVLLNPVEDCWNNA